MALEKLVYDISSFSNWGRKIFFHCFKNSIISNTYLKHSSTYFWIQNLNFPSFFGGLSWNNSMENLFSSLIKLLLLLPSKYSIISIFTLYRSVILFCVSGVVLYIHLYWKENVYDVSSNQISHLNLLSLISFKQTSCCISLLNIINIKNKYKMNTWFFKVSTRLPFPLSGVNATFRFTLILSF